MPPRYLAAAATLAAGAAAAAAGGNVTPCVLYAPGTGAHWELGVLDTTGNLSALISLPPTPLETGVGALGPNGTWVTGSDAYIVPGGTDAPAAWAQVALPVGPSGDARVLATTSVGAVPGKPGPATVLAVAAAASPGGGGSGGDRVVALLANSEAVLGLGCGQPGQWAVIADLHASNGTVATVWRDVNAELSCALANMKVGLAVLTEGAALPGTGAPAGATLWVVADDTVAGQQGIAGFALTGQPAGNYTFLPGKFGTYDLQSLAYSPAVGGFVSLAVADVRDGATSAAYVALNSTTGGPTPLFTYPPGDKVVIIGAGLAYLPAGAGGRQAAAIIAVTGGGAPADSPNVLSVVDLVGGAELERRPIAQDAGIQSYNNVIDCGAA
jgi:hypothetical protein